MGDITQQRIKKYQIIKFLRKRKNKFIVIVYSFAVILYLISSFVFFLVKIEDSDMFPTLEQGDIAYFKKNNFFFYNKEEKKIKIGDIIAYQSPHKDEPSIYKKTLSFFINILTLGLIQLTKKQVVIKRVVALPGDYIEIKNKKIFLNQRYFEPEWIVEYKDINELDINLSKRDNLKLTFVPKNHIYVLNDQWDIYNDSRTHGLISQDRVEGVFIYKLQKGR